MKAPPTGGPRRHAACGQIQLPFSFFAPCLQGYTTLRLFFPGRRMRRPGRHSCGVPKVRSLRFLPAPCLDRYLSFSSCLAFAASGESVKGCNSKKSVCACACRVVVCARGWACVRVCVCTLLFLCVCARVRVCARACRVVAVSSPCRFACRLRRLLVACFLSVCACGHHMGRMGLRRGRSVGRSSFIRCCDIDRRCAWSSPRR